MNAIQYQIATLLYCFDTTGRILLMRRKKTPNQGLWSPPGGKLARISGESPHACARREASEELGIQASLSDFQLKGIVNERNSEGKMHWLMFLFEYLQPLQRCPPTHLEGSFAFFTRGQLDKLDVPATDRAYIWPLFWKHRDGFFMAECRFNAVGTFKWTLLESSSATESKSSSPTKRGGEV
ncbi:MAG: NUDIX hydrolase [Verrucomicrobiota bacterium]|nr:NUDIX hydrolase [Verrucomicrobiota bacterium]